MNFRINDRKAVSDGGNLEGGIGVGHKKHENAQKRRFFYRRTR